MKLKNYQHPVLFYALSTIIPWALWLIAAYISHHSENEMYQSIFGILGLIAPFLIALFLMFRNRELKQDFLSRFLNFKKVNIKYLFITCFLMLFSILLAQFISLGFGYSISQFQFAKEYTFTSGVFPVWFLLIFAPLVEELAWHSYGTDCLRKRFNLFKTSMIFALYWGVWHIPLSFIKDYYQSNVVESGMIYSFNFIFSLFPFVLIMNWLYYKTGRNIIVPIIFHITAGYFNEIFATHPMSKVIQTGLLTIFAIYLIINDKSFFFNKENDVETSIKKNYKMKNILATIFLVIAISTFSFAQTITQMVKGSVIDETTQEAIIGATIVLLDSNPMKGTVTDMDGNFNLEKVPVGRQGIEVSALGYDTYVMGELLINSGKQVILNIELQESTTQLNEIVVTSKRDKDKALNSMATLSSRQFSVEETQRYAGGLNDPARLVSSFAGVATPSISSNGISIRGNSPSGLLWRIEGVEVPSPNHFANLTIAGAGLLTVLSSQMMGNSDFYTGAFPAEYGNATSGVFDINLRKGNADQREYTFQAGLIGVDFATEGPFVKGEKASYLLNYRYSTMALISPILPSNSGILKYQDLSYKINIPTRNTGTFSLWSIGALDGIDIDAVDSLEWQAKTDRDNSQTSLYMFASGVKHKIALKSNTFLNSSLSVTGNGLSHKEQRLDDNLQAIPQSDAFKNDYKYTLQSSVTKYFGNNHTNRTGFYLSHLSYDLDVKQSLGTAAPLTQLVDEKGQSNLFQFYSQSKLNLSPQLTMNAGFHLQYFDVNKDFSIEPRLAFKYKINEKNSLALAYGLHSKIETLPIYFVNKKDKQPNKDLKLMKSNHFVFSFNSMLSENLKLSVEPYYQYLTNVPVATNGYVSTLNIENSLFFNEVLVSEGTGRNLGVDFTLERYLNKGLYYLFSASVFDSKYTTIDGVERNTRFNKNYVFNAIIGKEWQVGKSKNNLFSANIRLNYLGGNRIENIDEQTSIQQEQIVFGETHGNLSFEKKHPDTPILSFTISYQKNKPKYSSIWTLQVLNATQTKEFEKDFYNTKTQLLEQKYGKLLIPSLSYKIEF